MEQLKAQSAVGSTRLLCGGAAQIGGFVIIETHEMREWWRRPRSRKSRIRNKWMANSANWRPRKDVLKIGNKLICHPMVARQLRRQIEAA